MKLQKEIEQEKLDAVNKKQRERAEYRKIIEENEKAKLDMIQKKEKQKEEDAKALDIYSKTLET